MGTATLTAGTLKYDSGLPGSLGPGSKVSSHPSAKLFAQLLMGATYATGGDTLDLSAYFDSIDGVQVSNAGTNLLQYIAGTTAANGKIKATVSSTGAELANGSNALAATIDQPIVIWGKKKST